jgi:hypothetical protein
MSRIKEYKVISETGLDAINKTVNEHIQDGWEPIGGISTFFISLPTQDRKFQQIGMEYTQAMGLYYDVIRAK